jgi:hypothetical protein
MTNISSTTRIIDLSSLYSQKKRFNRSEIRLLKKASRQSGGSALGLIHPLYCKPLLSQPDKISTNYFIQQQISESGYSSYLYHIEDYLKKTLEPIFVFAPPRERPGIEAWIKNLQIASMVVLLNTEGDDPVPRFDMEVDEHKSWQILANILKKSKISLLKLAGEIAFVEGLDEKGCVYHAFARLSSFVSVEIIPHLTYPNLKVSPHSCK